MRSIAMAVLLVVILAGTLFADDHGDSALSATPMDANGLPVDACIEEPEDMDYYLFSAVAGRSYQIRTTHQTVDMHSVLYLFASDGQTILAVAHDAEEVEGATISWSCAIDGTYFIMVRHAQASTGTGCYALSISLEVLDDHGDNALSATPVTPGGSAVPGFIETPEDVDAFLFTARRGYQYVVRLNRTSDQGDLILQLTGDAIVAREIRIEDHGELAIVPEQAGSLFLLVSASNTQATIGYRLDVHQEGYADDYGNSSATASVLEPHGTSIEGVIEVEDDSDWFSLAANADGEYVFSLSSSAGLTCRLALRSADGTVLIEKVGSTSAAVTTLEWTAPRSGRYYVEVSPVSGSGTYLLAITSTLHIESIGRFNPAGYSLDVHAHDALAYLIVGVRGLSIIDVSDPTAPQEIGSHSTRGYAEAIAVLDSLALVANRGDGLTVLDVSDPSRPAEIDHIETPGWAQDIAVEGDTAVVADQRAGIHIIHIANSGELRLLSTYATQGHAGAVTISNGIAYVAIGDAGLEIIDVSDPENPVHLATVALSGDARDVVVHGTTAYVASGYRGVRIIDISAPEMAQEIGWFGTTEEAVGLHVAGSHLYVAERDGVSVYTVTDPVAPERAARIETPGEAVAVFVADGLMFIADRQEGLCIARLLP